MELNADTRMCHGSRPYRILRPVFVAGMVLSLVLYFIPWYTPTGDVLRAWLATGGVERRLSSFDLCRLLVAAGDVQHGGFYLALTAVELAVLLLAVQRPRRWVFVIGAGEQLYTLIAFLLRSRANDLPYPWFSDFLYYAAWAMCLTGFLVRPPPKRTEPPSAPDPTVQP